MFFQVTYILDDAYDFERIPILILLISGNGIILGVTSSTDATCSSEADVTSRRVSERTLSLEITDDQVVPGAALSIFTEMKEKEIPVVINLTMGDLYRCPYTHG
jgi:hypothetical protein